MAAVRRDILRVGTDDRASRGRMITAARQRRDLELALASFAHEVRTPLNGVLALAELIAASELPARQREWADGLKGAAEHISQLTNLIVNGARAGTRRAVQRPQEFDCRAMAQSLAQSLAARAAGKGLQVGLALADDLPTKVRGDPVLLRAIVENLIDNAVKFTATGKVSLAVVGTRLRGDARMRLDVAVSDEGCGLTPTQAARLFRPFAQASRDTAAHGGAGLGLYFARRIARQMGGSLRFDSELGRGSTFRLAVRLDLVPREPRSDLSPNLLPSTSSRRLHILCAEDNPYGRVVFKAMATAFGHSVDFVETGEAALHAARMRAYDLVMLDVELQGLGGVDAARRLHAEWPSLAILGMSGRASPADIAAALAAGMNAYLAKPISAAALNEAFETAMRDCGGERQDSGLSPEAADAAAPPATR